MPLSQNDGIAELLTLEVVQHNVTEWMAPSLVTSNLPFDEWTNKRLFGSERLTGALLDDGSHTTFISWR